MGAYEAQLVTRVDSAAAFPDHEVPSFTVITDAHLKVKPPSEAYVSLQLRPRDATTAQPASSPPMVVLYDGETIWAPAMRLDQRRLARSARPLDSRYQIRGSGLLPQKDLVETVRSFLNDYTFEPNARTHESEDGVVHRLVGEIPVDRLIEIFMADPDRVAGLSAAPEGIGRELINMTAASLSTMRRLELSIDPTTSLPRRWTFGREGAAISTKVERFDTQVVFDDTVFTIPEADRQNAVDRTDVYLDQLSRSTPPSAERTEELRASLHEAVQRLIAEEADAPPSSNSP